MLFSVPSIIFLSIVLLVCVLALFILSKHLPEIFFFFYLALPTIALSLRWSKSVLIFTVNNVYECKDGY